MVQEEIRKGRWPGLGCTRHGVERLFQSEATVPSHLRTAKITASKQALLAEIEHLHPQANQILEVTTPNGFFERFFSLTDDTIIFTADSTGQGISYYFSGVREQASLGNEIIATRRVSSLSALAVFLRYFFRDQAAKLCFTMREVSEENLNLLHRSGYHTIWMPNQEEPIHCPIMLHHPGEVAAHDAGHTKIWSEGVSVDDRIVATLFYESIRKYVSRYDQVRTISVETRSLIDLGFRNRFFEPIYGIRDRNLSRDTTTKVYDDFLARLDVHYEGQEMPSKVRSFKNSVRSLISG